MSHCYLTIDDSPSPFTAEMCNFLIKQGIPALLFVRGDMVEQYGDQDLIEAVKNGFVLGNHAYTHTHFQNLGYDSLITEIEKTESILNRVYDKAGVKRPGKYFRFPHMDRGAGGYVVDYDACPETYRQFVTDLFMDGVRLNLTTPSKDDIDKKARLQIFLKDQGFVQPFQGVSYPWFKDSEMEQAADCMYTFSTSDWMVLNRHRGRWKYKSLQDLKAKIDDDPWLNSKHSRSIILIHDKTDPEFPEIFKSLIDHMLGKDYEFLSIL